MVKKWGCLYAWNVKHHQKNEQHHDTSTCNNGNIMGFEKHALEFGKHAPILLT